MCRRSSSTTSPLLAPFTPPANQTLIRGRRRYREAGVALSLPRPSADPRDAVDVARGPQRSGAEAVLAGEASLARRRAEQLDAGAPIGVIAKALGPTAYAVPGDVAGLPFSSQTLPTASAVERANSGVGQACSSPCSGATSAEQVGIEQGVPGHRLGQACQCSFN